MAQKKTKKVKIASNEKVTKKKLSKMRKKPGGSNVGEYKKVPAKLTVGEKGGAPEGSYPINTKKRARAALMLAHNAPNPAGIKRAVYKRYPDLKPNSKPKAKTKKK